MCPVARCRRGLRRDLSGSALPTLPQSVSRGPVFRGFTGSPLLRPVRLLAPLDGSDRVSPATGGFYIQASDGSVTLPLAGYDYNSTGLLCWRDFHPQEWQLASLHQIRAGPIRARGSHLGCLTAKHAVRGPAPVNGGAHLARSAGENGCRARGLADQPEPRGRNEL